MTRRAMMTNTPRAKREAFHAFVAECARFGIDPQTPGARAALISAQVAEMRSLRSARAGDKAMQDFVAAGRRVP